MGRSYSRSRSRSRERHRRHQRFREHSREPREPQESVKLQEPKTVKQIIFESRVNPITKKAFSRRYFDILKTRRHLPVFEFLDIFEDAFTKNKVIVVEGETGSGKTTQIPQALLLHLLRQNLGKQPHIACTQPRRVAATSVAKRVSEEMDVVCGEEVGYSVRFEDNSGPKTMLKYLTDGMLLREAINDPLLRTYDVIILDEVHERTVATDVIMGMLKEIFHYRNDLKVIVMSATIDASSFQKYFDNAPLFKVPGRLFPVEVFYTASPEKNYVDAAVKTVEQIHLYEKEGDILLFLTGEQEIQDTCQRLAKDMNTFPLDKRNLMVLPLFSSLPPQQQQQAFTPTPTGFRKVVVSTNIAETSVTINGIVYVVDSGFHKEKVYNAKTRVESLLVTPISQASAKQRAGRAGRTQPGKCFRLYTEQSFEAQLPMQSTPEILRGNIASVVLTLKRLGVENLGKFDFMAPPSSQSLLRALEALHMLGALDDCGAITSLGSLLAEFPLEPQLAKCLILAPVYECLPEMICIVSMLSVPNVFVQQSGTQGRKALLAPFHREGRGFGDIEDEEKELEGGSANPTAAEDCKRLFANAESDHITLLNVFNAFMRVKEEEKKDWCTLHYLNFRSLAAAVSIHEQLCSLAERMKLPMVQTRATPLMERNRDIRKCLCHGFFMQVAKFEKDGNYITVKDNQFARIHPATTTTTSPEWVIYNELVLTSTNYMRTVTQVEGKWLAELEPYYYDISNFPDGCIKSELVRIYKEMLQLCSVCYGSIIFTWCLFCILAVTFHNPCHHTE